MVPFTNEAKTVCLSVNVNKIALLRNSRGEGLPDVVSLSQLILDTGAHGITIHPRSDGRHIRPQDAHDLKKLLLQYPSRELNIEGNPYHQKQDHPHVHYPGFMNLVLSVLPDQVTLVPDQENQLTSNHGWNLKDEHQKLSSLIQNLKDHRLRVSLFVDPSVGENELSIARDLGVDRIELYTDEYAKSDGGSVIKNYQRVCETAHRLGLAINAGHALSLDNLEFFVEHLPYLEEVSIGHALVCESLLEGLVPTVKKYLKILEK